MREIYLEESVETVDKSFQKKKYLILSISSIFCYVFGFAWALIFFYLVKNLEFINYIVIFFPFFLFVGIGYVIGSFKHRAIVDFDYSFTSGTVRFAKVYNESRRKTIISFENNNIEKIGRYNSDFFKKYSLVDSIKNIPLTNNSISTNNKGFYYIVVNKNGEKYLFTLECTYNFINAIISYSNNYVVEEGFYK